MRHVAVRRGNRGRPARRKLGPAGGDAEDPHVPRHFHAGIRTLRGENAASRDTARREHVPSTVQHGRPRRTEEYRPAGRLDQCRLDGPQSPQMFPRRMAGDAALVDSPPPGPTRRPPSPSARRPIHPSLHLGAGRDSICALRSRDSRSPPHKVSPQEEKRRVRESLLQETGESILPGTVPSRPGQGIPIRVRRRAVRREGER